MERRSQTMLCLPLADPLLRDMVNEGVVLREFSLNKAYAKKIEQAGEGYEELKHRINGKKKASKNGKEEEKKSKNKSSEEEDDEEVDPEEQSGEHKSEWEKKRHKKTKDDLMREALLGDDLYALLGLEKITLGATEHDIRKAYKKLALTYHPDKIMKEESAGDSEAEKEHKKTLWLKIQSAYERLSDPAKKKQYDSTLPFDDAIPDEADNINDKNFFEKFEEVFKRNSQWSKKKPAPTIGDMTTTAKKLKEFYKFWENFDSWRDFAAFDEYDVKEASDRYERRYMEKENKKLREKHNKKERSRIMKLVDLAYKYDPRIKAENEKLEEEKAKAKKAKQDRIDEERKVIRDRELEIERKKQEEVDKKKAEERVVQEAKDKKKHDFQIEVKKFESLLSEKVKEKKYDIYFAEEFVKKLQQADLESVNAVLEQSKTQDVAVKCLEKFIADFTKHTVDKKKQESMEREKKKKMEEEEAKKIKEWSPEELSLLAKGVNKYPVGLKNRWKLIAEYMGGRRDIKEVIARAQDTSTLPVLGKAGIKDFSQKPAQASPVQKSAEEKTPEAKKDVPPPVDPAFQWSPEQQRQLEAALRKHSAKLLPKERWSKIACEVESKTPKQCLERFKEICEMLKKEKETK